MNLPVSSMILVAYGAKLRDGSETVRPDVPHKKDTSDTLNGR